MRRLAALTVALVACRARPPEPAPCSTVARRYVAVAREGLGSADDALRRAARARLPLAQAALETLCTDGKWSGPARDCMTSSDDQVAFAECQRLLTDEQRAALDTGETRSP